MTPVTTNFSEEEFASHDGVLYPADAVDDDDLLLRSWYFTRLVPLCQMLEQLRAKLGSKPIRILSGYRSPAHNLAVGGALKSQHMEGRAVDIQVDGATPAEVHEAVMALYLDGEIEIGGLGIYPSWNHIDIRRQVPVGHLATWSGGKVGDEK